MTESGWCSRNLSLLRTLMSDVNICIYVFVIPKHWDWERGRVNPPKSDVPEPGAPTRFKPVPSKQ